MAAISRTRRSTCSALFSTRWVAKIYVPRWPPRVQRGDKYAALQHELVCMRGARQKGLPWRRAESVRPLVPRFASPCAGGRGTVGRSQSLWSLESQHDFQGVANRALGTAEGSGHLDQRRRPGTLSSKPAAQRLPRDLCPFPMAQPDHIDQRALGGVEAEGQTVPDPDHLPAKGIFGEDVTVRGRLQGRD